jgi:acetyltransferase-like isoleucine patch superfamily enzyme
MIYIGARMSFKNYGSILTGDVEIGEGTKIGHYGYIEGKVGKNCNIQNGVHIYKGTVIGDNVFIGPGTLILNDKYPPSHGKAWQPVSVGDDARIGGGVTINPGVTIGERAIVGAGSVVTKDVESGACVYGNPAKRRELKA